MRLLITGGNGQLAYDLRRVYADEHVVAATHADLDVCDPAAVKKTLHTVQPDVVINTAAFTRVDDCETEVQKAFAVNAFGVLHLARECQALGCILAQISTDYVFTGIPGKPNREDDPPNPPNVYGVAKLAGENFARSFCNRHFVIRTSGLYGKAGSSGKGGNFVETMLRLAKAGQPIRVVKDQVLSPTSTADLASSIRELLQKSAYGIYHLTNSDACSWFDFAEAIFRLRGMDVNLTPISSAAYAAKARRPVCSVLDNSKTLALGLKPMRSWHDALTAYLATKI